MGRVGLAFRIPQNITGQGHTATLGYREKQNVPNSISKVKDLCESRVLPNIHTYILYIYIYI